MAVQDALVNETASLRDTLTHIEAGGIQMAVVVDEQGRLVGIVTDGDARRGMLRGDGLDSPVTDHVNRNPVTVLLGTSDNDILDLMRREALHQIIVVDESNRVVDLKYLSQLIRTPARPNLVVLMVGGLGSRLGDLTKATPKPMLPVAGRPMLEIIIESFVQQGFRRFVLAVNYGAAAIETYFGDGARHGCSITYVREVKRMGTAGALSLLAEIPDEPFLVSNGDLLLRCDYRAMLAHHEASGAEATMAVREYSYEVPYGVVTVENGVIAGLEEKPRHSFLISGGLYVLAPETLKRIPADTLFDMPSLFADVVQSGSTAAVFPIEGYWLDIGHFADYERAQVDYAEVFHGGRAAGSTSV